MRYWVRLRSSKSHKKNRAILWSSSAKYDLKQFEDALRSQGTDDPLVALINDQVANLNQMGFDRAEYISSLLDVSEN